jgi:hypothetical protein
LEIKKYEHLIITHFDSCGAEDGDSSKMHAHFLREVLVQEVYSKSYGKAPQEQFKGQSLSSPRPVATASHLSLTLSMRKKIWSQHHIDPRRLKPSPWKALSGAKRNF